MRKVTRGPVPADLDGPDSSGGKERADVCAFYRERDNLEASYKKYSA